MKRLWKYIKILITLGILIFFIYYFINNKDDFLLVLRTPFLFLIIIGLFYSIVFLLNGIFIKIILASFQKVISVTESWYVSVISSLGNYFLPMRGGAVIRSVYLKKNFDFSYSHFVATLYGYYIIVFLINSFFALISLLFIYFNFGVVSIPLYLFFGGLFLAMLVLSLVRFPTEKIKEEKFGILGKIVKIIKKILNGWNIIVKDKKLLISLVVITILTFLVHIFLYWIEFSALNIETTFINVLLYNSLSGVSLLVSLTPGSLGIREGIFVITSDILGITSDQVMQLALLDRGVMVIALVVLFLILFILNKLIISKNEDWNKIRF